MNINLLREGNYEVTNKYLDTIAISLKESLESKNQSVSIIEYNNLKDLKKLNKKEIIIVSTVLEGVKLLLLGYKNVIIWYQGVVPEESYMKNKSKIKRKVLSIFEKYCLKRCKYRVFVSDEQKKYYEIKYKIIIDNNYFVMPCFNAKYNAKSFKIKNKYDSNKFCYIGSTAKWQQFEEIAHIYKKIEERIDNSEFVILTGDLDNAKSVIKKLDIKKYIIKHVKPEKVNQEIEKCKYGFILRENCIVNRVATPTKLGNYLACGVIPIFSDCLVSFNNATKNIENKISINNIETAVSTIIAHTKKPIDLNKIIKEYESIFDEYYNFDYYKDNLKKKFDILF